jgi:hypothetical protein
LNASPLPHPADSPRVFAPPKAKVHPNGNADSLRSRSRCAMGRRSGRMSQRYRRTRPIDCQRPWPLWGNSDSLSRLAPPEEAGRFRSLTCTRTGATRVAAGGISARRGDYRLDRSGSGFGRTPPCWSGLHRAQKRTRKAPRPPCASHGTSGPTTRILSSGTPNLSAMAQAGSNLIKIV